MEDIDFSNRRVLVRADLNVPLKGADIDDDSRIRAAIPTVRKLIDQQARVILCSHLGRPEGRVDDALRLDPVAARLGQLLDLTVRKLDDCVGPHIERLSKDLRQGEVILLENTRFHKGETENDPDFASRLAALADFYINDAFATAHRAHASTEGVAHHRPAVAGMLMDREIRALQAVKDNPRHPFVAVFGGAKVSGKIETLESLLDSLHMVLAGGAFVATLLAASGIDVGDSVVEADSLDAARRVRERAGDKLVLPVDVKVAREKQYDARTEIVTVENIQPGFRILDIGPQTIELFSEKVSAAKTVIWNGPLGVFEMEPFQAGTFAMAHELARLDATTVAGGGDTTAALKKAGVESNFTHLSTGGGAFLAFLAGKSLPAIAALQDREA